MMRIFHVIFLLFASVACSKYNDSELRRRVDAVESRIESLEQKLNDYNNSLQQLSRLIEAQQSGDLISSVDSMPDNKGWKIVFVSGKEICIYNGEDGKDGANGKDGKDGNDGSNGVDAVAPVVSVRQDEAGIWCWTINGEWLLADGKRVKAAGIDGLTPEFFSENGNIYVRYSSDSQWELIGSCGAETSSVEGLSSVFTNVSRIGETVVFVLSDGATISLPISTSAAEYISFADPYVKAICIRNFDTDHDGELSYEEAAAVRSLGGVFSNISLINMHYANDYWNAGILQLGNPALLSFDELKYFTSLESIGSEEFSFDINLWKISFPAGLSSVGSNKTLTFTAADPGAGGRQSGTYTLSYGPFTNCPLSEVTFLSETPIGTKPFFEVSANCRILVPETALDAYKGAWNTFAEQIEAIK